MSHSSLESTQRKVRNPRRPVTILLFSIYFGVKNKTVYLPPFFHFSSPLSLLFAALCCFRKRNRIQNKNKWTKTPGLESRSKPYFLYNNVFLWGAFMPKGLGGVTPASPLNTPALHCPPQLKAAFIYTETNWGLVVCRWAQDCENLNTNLGGLPLSSFSPILGLLFRELQLTRFSYRPLRIYRCSANACWLSVTGINR